MRCFLLLIITINLHSAEWLYTKNVTLKELLTFYSSEYKVDDIPQLIDCENNVISCFFSDVKKDFFNKIAKQNNLDYKNDIISKPQDVIAVVPSLGLGSQWLTVFPNELKQVGDQLVISGTKTRVNEIQTSIKQLSKLSIEKVRILAVYADKQTADDLGVNLSSWLKFSYSYLDVERKMYEFIAEVNEVEDRAIDVNLNNEVTLIAGREFEVFLGSSEQKEIFTVNAETGERLQSGFIDIEKGLTLNLKSFRSDANLLLDVNLVDESTTENEVSSKLTYSSTVQLDNQLTQVLNISRQTTEDTESSLFGIHRLFDWSVFKDKTDSVLVFRVFVLKQNDNN